MYWPITAYVVVSSKGRRYTAHVVGWRHRHGSADSAPIPFSVCRWHTMTGHMSVSVINQPVYSVSAAAEILRVPPSTLRWWLDGHTVRGRTYEPVIRPERTGENMLTWAEFVEAGLLCQYRRSLEVHLTEIREVIALLREKLGVPYPLANGNL